MEERKYTRPKDVKTTFTTDPAEMLGKYLINPVLKTWMEDFRDTSTGEIVQIERSEVLVPACRITKDVLPQIEFFMQSGDIQGVDVCDNNCLDMHVSTSNYMDVYRVDTVQLPQQVFRYICMAQSVVQAITIATEYGQMYRGVRGSVVVTKVAAIDVTVIPDGHECIPEAVRFHNEYTASLDYFCVTVRTSYIDDSKTKNSDRTFVIVADDVGQAKERVSRYLEIRDREAAERGERIDGTLKRKIIKAMPCLTDCVVPLEYSELYREEGNP